jgi:hypothetical protein
MRYQVELSTDIRKELIIVKLVSMDEAYQMELWIEKQDRWLNNRRTTPARNPSTIQGLANTPRRTHVVVPRSKPVTRGDVFSDHNTIPNEVPD